MKTTFLIIFTSIVTLKCFSAKQEIDTLHLHYNLTNKSDSIALNIDDQDSIYSIMVDKKMTQNIENFRIPDSIYIKRLAALPFEFKMTFNPIVLNYIKLYTQKIKYKLQVMIGLSEFYFPIFEDILGYYGIPDELKYIPIIESALNPGAVSRARAVGLWQFVKGTGRENGLIINTYVDQRRSPIEATHAAAKYLKKLYDIYGDWQLVLAAYDCGPGNVNRAIYRSKGKRDFWEIYKYLPRETRGYIPEFIGAAYAFNYYREHDLDAIPMSLPLETDTILVRKTLQLKQVSKILNLPLGTIRELNPQYIKDVIPATGKTKYFIRIPTELKSRFFDSGDSLYTYNGSFNFSKEIQKQAYSNQTPFSSDTYQKTIHVVRKGESIWLIAEQYNVSIKNIKEWNNISGNMIKAGQKLIIYVPKKTLPHKEV